MTIWIAGAGNMGGAMLRRWLDTGLNPASVTVIRKSDAPFGGGVRTEQAVPEGSPDILMLGFKPQMLDAIAPLYAGVRPRVLISILAGVEEASLASRFHAQAIVLASPNLPVALGQGIVALNSGSADPSVRDEMTALMAPLGLVEWIDAARFEAIGVLTGCGPAFTYRFIDSLAAAGVALGLPTDQAQRLAIATVDGAGALAAASDASPEELADRVASPGGSTRAGLNVLDRDAVLLRLMLDTLQASARRSEEMAEAAR